jgi:hypothetical protein
MNPINKHKLTKIFVDEISLSTRGQQFYNDAELRGFKLRVTPGAKSYIVERRVNGVNRRVTIGKHGALRHDIGRVALRNAQRAPF